MAVIIRKPSFFHQIWNKIYKDYKDDYLYIIIRQNSLYETNDYEEKTKPELKVIKFPENSEE